MKAATSYLVYLAYDISTSPILHHRSLSYLMHKSQFKFLTPMQY